MINYLTVSNEDLVNDEELSTITDGYFGSVKTCSSLLFVGRLVH